MWIVCASSKKKIKGHPLDATVFCSLKIGIEIGRYCISTYPHISCVFMHVRYDRSRVLTGHVICVCVSQKNVVVVVFFLMLSLSHYLEQVLRRTREQTNACAYV